MAFVPEDSLLRYPSASSLRVIKYRTNVKRVKLTYQSGLRLISTLLQVRGRLLVRNSLFANRLFIRPGTQCFCFHFGKVRLGMHGSVLPRRHPACRYQSADGFQFVLPLRCRIRFPVGQIQAIPAFAYVPRDPPGYWCNMAVPRPISMIGVAVPTRPHQDVRRL